MSKIIFRGSMPAPKHKHGEVYGGGIVLGRSYEYKTWWYTVMTDKGVILYVPEI